jgi:hypothetical protein
MKKAIVMGLLGVFFVAADAGADDEPKHGTRGTVSAYASDETTVIKVKACEWDGVTHKYLRCEEDVTWYVNTHWCPEHKGHKWFMQVSTGHKMPLHCKH